MLMTWMLPISYVPESATWVGNEASARVRRKAKFKKVDTSGEDEPTEAEDDVDSSSGSQTGKKNSPPEEFSSGSENKTTAGSAGDTETQAPVDSKRYFEDLPGKTITGVPRLIRQMPYTEVTFKTSSDSYVIPPDNRHNTIMHAFERAIDNNESISFRVDPDSKRILYVDGIENVTAKARNSREPRPGKSSNTGSSAGKTGTQ